jgi:hypothetical protein
MSKAKVWHDARWTVFSVVLTGGRGVLDLRLDPNLLTKDEKRDQIAELVGTFVQPVEDTLGKIRR